MLAGRSANRVFRLEAALDVAMAGRLGPRAVDFRTLEFRLDRFEITVSPPHLRVFCKKLASRWAPIQRPGCDRVRQSQAERGWFEVSATLSGC
jgi:hypothetical protein